MFKVCITIEKEFLVYYARYLKIKTPEGEMGIAEGHIPFIGYIRESIEISLEKRKERIDFFEGIICFANNEAKIVLGG